LSYPILRARPPLPLPSFPTRRSSDLAALGSAAAAGAGGFALAGTLALNGGFLAAIRTSEGTGRALAAIPLLWLELLVVGAGTGIDRKSTRLNSSHVSISYAVFCLQKK